MNLKKIKPNIANILKNLNPNLGALSVLSAVDISKIASNTDWYKSLNDYTSQVSKSMDKEFLSSLKGESVEKMAPIYHRIVDGGHDLFSSIDIAKSIGEENNWSSLETFSEWSKSYFSDLTCSAGMPIFGKMSENIYTFLKSCGISEAQARDLVTINGQEALDSILSGSITFLALIFSWKNEDKEAFSKTLGSIFVTGITTLNPITMAIFIVAMGIGYQKLVNKEDIAKGSIISGSGLAVSALIPGPIILGVIPAIVISVYLSKKMEDDFNPIKNSKHIASLIASKEFRKDCFELFSRFFDKSKGENHA